MQCKYFLATALCLAAFSFTSCSDDDDDQNIPELKPEPQNPDESGAGKMILQGKVGDVKDANMVYVDFGSQKQETVARNSWHLSFYCGNDFRVALNQSLTRAQSTGKTDFAAVTLEDAKAAAALNAGMMNFPNPAEAVITDDANRDLSKTVFGDIASDEAKSEVFLVATEGMEDRATWFKVKVTRAGEGYKVEFGRVEETVAKVVNIKKDASKDFVGFSLSKGEVVNLPQRWDIMWSSAIALNKMPNGREILGPASDVITSNSYANVETAKVMVAEAGAYKDFSKADLDKVKFEKDADVIGTGWRTAPMPNATPGPNADRFYVIKNADGKCYKLRFIHFCEEDGGERGLPELEFELLK